MTSYLAAMDGLVAALDAHATGAQAARPEALAARVDEVRQALDQLIAISPRSRAGLERELGARIRTAAARYRDHVRTLRAAPDAGPILSLVDDLRPLD